MAFQPSFRVVRADDQLVLDVALEGMTTIFAPPTTVVLTVPKNTPPVPATVVGVLDLTRRLALVTDERAGAVSVQRAPAPVEGLPAAHGIVATRAAAQGRPVDPEVLRCRQTELARRVPAETAITRRETQATTGPTTEFAFPYLPTVRPPGGDTRLNHPTTATPNQFRVPLWTTELGVTNGNRTVSSTNGGPVDPANCAGCGCRSSCPACCRRRPGANLLSRRDSSTRSTSRRPRPRRPSG